MNDNFPRVRRQAIKDIQDYLPQMLPEWHSVNALALKLLMSEDAPSFLIPTDFTVEVKAGAADFSNLNLPFPKLVLEWTASLAFVCEEGGNFCLYPVLTTTRGRFAALPGVRFNKNTYHGLAGDKIYYHESADMEWFHRDDYLMRQLAGGTGNALAHLYDFLVVANCANVEVTKLYEPSAALTKRSLERGKLKPTTYWELRCFDARSRTVRAEPGGGSHASPRFHVRRGHVRRLPGSERTIWVRNTTVGTPQLGIVHKSYKL